MNCGNRFGTFDKYCKWCGDKRQAASKPLKCPVCDNKINYYSDFCQFCGFVLTKDLNYEIRESEVKSCPSCNARNNMDAQVCTNCGKDLPITSELNLIECPDCGRNVRDDVNFCRYCGYSFIKGKKSFLPKKPKQHSRHCQNCGSEVASFEEFKFCNGCGTRMPFDKDLLNLHEDQMLRLTNKFLVPISIKYNVNFRKTHLKDYFNLDENQESQIFSMVAERIKTNPNEDIVPYFESVLEQINGKMDIGSSIDNNESSGDSLECQNCGALNDKNNKFCVGCGSKLEQVKHCPNCNKTYEGDVKFCSNCGTKLS